MKLVIFGATSSIGRQLTAQALAAGHQVTAFTRTPAKITASHSNLFVVAGNVTDPKAVEDAVKNQGAVLCALGMPLTNKDNLREKGTRTILTAMENTGVMRLVCLSIFGAGDSYALLPWSYRLIVFPLILRRALKDHELQEKHIWTSNLDWVIVRPTNFTDNSASGGFWHGLERPPAKLSLKISRSELAQFMLEQVVSDKYVHQMPGISH